MVNKVTLIGNLGKDPIIRVLEGGASVAQFSVATSESYLNKNTNEWMNKTEWHNVVAWRHLAERAEKFLHKGSQVYVEGKLTHRKWQDKDGNDRYSTEVVANVLRLLGRKEDNPNNNTSVATDSKVNYQVPSTADLPKATDTDTAKSVEDDLPF